jgi:hypothetical protein
MKIDIKDFYNTILMLSRGFGIDLSVNFKKPSASLVNSIGIDNANKILVTITLDEIFIFTIYFLFNKAAEKLKLKHFLEVESHIKQDLFTELIAQYCLEAKSDDKRKTIFNPDNFMVLFKERTSEYLEFRLQSDIIPIAYFLEIMTKSFEKLEYYKSNNNFLNDKKLQIFALDDFKWLDEQVDKLVNEYFIEKK